MSRFPTLREKPGERANPAVTRDMELERRLKTVTESMQRVLEESESLREQTIKLQDRVETLTTMYNKAVKKNKELAKVLKEKTDGC